MKKFLSVFAIVGLLVGIGMHATPVKAATSTLASLSSGDLVRGTTFSAVYYYGADGFRYVFPNSKTYSTWYANFDTVKTLSDADLGTIQIGGNVTYKPGSRMVKINSDPKTYAVDDGGALRWVSTEEVAVAMYGSSWNTMIDDVPDAFFGNYTMGSNIETTEDAQDFNAQFLGHTDNTINDDKELKAATVVNVTDSGYSRTTYTIQAGTAVRFVNGGTMSHTATADDESWGTGTMTSDQSFARYFKTAGTWTFHCNYHSSMTATIIVE